MTPAQPPLPTAWNLPFQPFAGSHTSILISQSDEGLSVAATPQKSGRALEGVPPLPPVCLSPGRENWLGGTSFAIVTLVSFNASVDTLSHEAADADTAHTNARMHVTPIMVGIFMEASRAS